MVVFECDDALPPPPEFPITIPTSAATTPTTINCHVRHDRRSLIRSDPGAGASGGGVVVNGGFHEDPLPKEGATGASGG